MIFWKIIYNLILLPLLFAFGIIGSLVNKKIRDGMMGRYRSFRELKSFMDERGAGKQFIGFTLHPMGNLNR